MILPLADLTTVCGKREREEKTDRFLFVYK